MQGGGRHAHRKRRLLSRRVQWPKAAVAKGTLDDSGRRPLSRRVSGRRPLSRRVSGRRPLSRRVLPGAAARGRCRQGYKRCAIVHGLVHVGTAIEQHPHERLVALLHADNCRRCTAVHGLVHVSTATSLVFKRHVWADCSLLLALLLTPQRQRACAEWNHEKTSEHSGPWLFGNGSNWSRLKEKGSYWGLNRHHCPRRVCANH